MKIRAQRKLTLSRETLSRLEDRQLADVQGANSVMSGCNSSCIIWVCMCR
jgi:hypothetical protein